MKGLVICCACTLVLSFGCAITQPPKPEMPEAVLERLAGDLAQINLISEGMRQASQKLPKGVKILEVLAPRKLKVTSPSGVKIHDVLTSRIQVPCKECPFGTTTAGIVKWGTLDQPVWGVMSPKMYEEVGAKGTMALASFPKWGTFSTATGSGYFYDQELAKDPEARSAITQTVGWWSSFENTVKDLVKRSLAKVQDIRKEYHSYLEITGFDISFPWGITLHTKLKTPPKKP